MDDGANNDRLRLDTFGPFSLRTSKLEVCFTVSLLSQDLLLNMKPAFIYNEKKIKVFKDIRISCNLRMPEIECHSCTLFVIFLIIST